MMSNNHPSDADRPITETTESNSTTNTRERRIYRVTILGSIINIVLLTLKFAAGILGHSAAMIADAVHSLSDFLTDIIVIIFVRISGKPADTDHDYGHGKYETLATAIIGLALFAVGIKLLLDASHQVYLSISGVQLEQPGWVAFAAAIISIVSKEWIYQKTVKVGKEEDSQAVIANAWHHRSDAMSSIGTAVGIGGALLLGQRWSVLDPLAAIIVSFFILWTAYTLIRQAVSELLEASLSKAIEDQIVALTEAEPDVTGVHHLRTRRIGNAIAIEMHVRMPGQLMLYHAHEHATNIEDRLREHFGERTFITLHIEPLKENGAYRAPDETTLPSQ